MEKIGDIEILDDNGWNLHDTIPEYDWQAEEGEEYETYLEELEKYEEYEEALKEKEEKFQEALEEMKNVSYSGS